MTDPLRGGYTAAPTLSAPGGSQAGLPGAADAIFSAIPGSLDAGQAIAALDDNDGDGLEAFPRLKGPTAQGSAATGGADEVVLEIHQRKASGLKQQSWEVERGPDGTTEIPLSVVAQTHKTRVKREMAMRSPFLARCLAAPDGCAITRALGSGEGEGDDDLEAFFDDPPEKETLHNAVVCKRVAEAVLDIGLPSHGAGHAFLTPSGLAECLELCAPTAAPFDAALLSFTQLLSLFLWAVVLGFASLEAACAEAIAKGVDVATVVLAAAAGTATGNSEITRCVYWCLRELLCSAAGPPAEWLDGSGGIRLFKGYLSYKSLCKVHLRTLCAPLAEDMRAKKELWQIPKDCYTLCQIHRIRGEDGAYPHIYEMRLDHSNEIVMTAIREDEQSSCKFFVGNAASAEKSEHCQEFIGSVVPNFWGTLFTCYDSGSDVQGLARYSPVAKDFPLRERTAQCKIGYETNILGNCPRKVLVDFERGGKSYHMENLQPRWDKKLNSYALPFFGRVKKASAKNFQLVIDNNMNTIYLMFGKISKDVFCLDYRGPLSALDAMGIACAALAKKRAVS
eukprot:TRINITY_DN74678_c0_g1_i1.p1 TRINITY_DN74678_c0_g1~~TRINITY_DN74678_c0_g1_i1.p1  ORF type:complete len:564 (+),score=151.20 TRINITY_DN74678_c0_g1_i1:324-2015(+)